MIARALLIPVALLSLFAIGCGGDDDGDGGLCESPYIGVACSDTVPPTIVSCNP